jgi:hypothetical protein
MHPQFSLERAGELFLIARMRAFTPAPTTKRFYAR